MEWSEALKKSLRKELQVNDLSRNPEITKIPTLALRSLNKSSPRFYELLSATLPDESLAQSRT